MSNVTVQEADINVSSKLEDLFYYFETKFLICLEITQSLDIIPYAEVDWSRVCKPSGEQQVPFLLCFYL